MSEGKSICEVCKSNDFKDYLVSTIDYIETEKERICNNCGNIMDYWAYGYWESNK